MTAIWIILLCILIILLSIEPVGQFFIRSSDIIYTIDVKEMKMHSGDSLTKVYLVGDENKNVYISNMPIPSSERLRITYTGFNMPKFGIFRKIISYEFINNEI